MISRIRMRIFIPMLFLILLFPLLSWGIFSSASDWYMSRLSRQSLEEMMGQIRIVGDRLYSGDEEVSRDEEKELSREFLSQIRAFIRKDRPRAQLLAVNSRLKLTYPKTGDYQPDTQAIYEVCREMILSREQGKEGWEDIQEARVGDAHYLISLYETESQANIRGKYLFCYVAVPDTKALLSYTGALLLLIAGVLALLALAAAWVVAGSIAKPLQALCFQTRSIGKGRFTRMERPCSIREIEELRRDFNRMAGELEQLNRQQTAFFQNASHELRTPLMSICGYAQGIQCGVFPDHQEAAGIILEEAMRMKELVDGILTMSKLDGGRVELNCREMDLAGFIRDELTSLKGMEVAEQIQFQMQEGPEPVMALADRELLERAFRNVISNCVRYAAGLVEVRAEMRDGWAAVTIADDGPGFPERDLPHVFERFYKGQGGNFGIGLSIVRTAMEYQGGRVEAYNRAAPGHGAVFVLWLPLKRK